MSMARIIESSIRRGAPAGPESRARNPVARRLLALPLLLGLAASGCADRITDTGTVPTSIELSRSELNLVRGTIETVSATVLDQHGEPMLSLPAGFAITWATSDPEVVRVADGLVSAHRGGRATITASAGQLTPAQLPVAVVSSYTATALGRVGGTQSNAWAINGSGIVAGWSNVRGGRAFRWAENSGATELAGISSSRGINSAGAIVGSFQHAGGFSAYVYLDGVRTDLAALQPGANSNAYRINDAGTVVGVSGPNGQPVVWRRGADGQYGPPQVLGYRSSNERPVLNGLGDVAFTAFSPSGSGLNEPVLWKALPDGSYAAPRFLGRPAGGSYFVREINDSGLIVGSRWTGSIEMAVLWHPDDYSAPTDLGVGEAWGINSGGWIVGTTGGELPTFGGVPRRPVLWIAGAAGVVAGPFDLGTPDGFAHGGARAINDQGWIVGSTWGPGEVMATLWRPEL
jgi:uncharacterized membrane protein